MFCSTMFSYIMLICDVIIQLLTIPIFLVPLWWKCNIIWISQINVPNVKRWVSPRTHYIATSIVLVLCYFLFCLIWSDNIESCRINLGSSLHDFILLFSIKMLHSLIMDVIITYSQPIIHKLFERLE